ncbi:MAG: ATP-binding cassette domain-containing protein, partial [Firmicutes bacterium]|nr:ATP-binding cassette domain-containing protein [Bacillota bacterium]
MSVVTVSHLTFGYDGSAENIFEDVSFQFDTDWKLGFTGHNGRGKTTFLNLLMGKYEYRGAISASVTFDYFPYAVADGKLPVLDVITAVAPGREAWEIERELGLLTLGGETLGRPFQTLSGGEQTRALLAALFLKGGHFPLIDEPTNHLDMEARDVLAAYLKRKSGFLLVSHDRAFLDGTVDHIL